MLPMARSYVPSRTLFVQHLSATGLLVFAMSFASEGVANDSPGALPVQWPLRLFESPAAVPAQDAYTQPDLHTAFLEGPPYRGRATRVFVYYGMPPRTGHAK